MFQVLLFFVTFSQRFLQTEQGFGGWVDFGLWNVRRCQRVVRTGTEHLVPRSAFAPASL